jgi:hypothetical protein
MDAWTANQACKITGVTYKQLDHWARTGLLVPSVAVAEGTGTMRLYNLNDLVALGVIKRFRDHGISLQAVRKSVSYLRSMLPEVKQPLSELYLFSDGNSIYLVPEGDLTDVFVDTLKGGQFVLGFALEGIARELEGKVKELPAVDGEVAMRKGRAEVA